MIPVEFSKKLLLSSWIVTIVLTAIVVVGAFVGISTGDIYLLAALAWAELATAHGFYFWKAKNENRAKGVQKLVKELAKEYGIDGVARIAELIFRD